MRRRLSGRGRGRPADRRNAIRGTDKEDARILVRSAQHTGVDFDAATDQENRAERLPASYQPTRVSAMWLRFWQPDGDSRLARVPVAPR